MTVCVAAIFRWNYGTIENPIPGPAGLILTDRMITAGDVQYEPQQLKVAFVTDKVLISIAGDYSMHSQALKDVARQLKTARDATPNNVAQLYGRAIQSINLKKAEDRYLAPLGLNTDTFMAQQRDMSEGFVQSIKQDLQSFRGDDVEALVLGSDGENVQLYSVDVDGSITCFDDVGFAAIGSGSWHARSRMMQAGYVNGFGLAPALAATFNAKKSAEIAPGVGKNTDIHFVKKDGHHPIWPKVHSRLDILYKEYEKSREQLALKAVNNLQAFLNLPDEEQEKVINGKETGGDEPNAEADGRTVEAPPENP